MHPERVRGVIPRGARERLYGWHPGRGRRWRRCPGLERLESRGRAALTFDDGPDPDATPAILDALDRVAARATFFMVGDQVQRHAALAREIERRGHEVALHGQRHRRLDRLSADAVHEDIVQGFTAVRDATGISAGHYRPPFGRMTAAAAEACRDLGMVPVYWSAWGIDWEDLPAERIAAIAATGLDSGAILLLHDSARYGRRSSARETAAAVPMIAARAAARGITLGSLAQITAGTVTGAPGR